MTDHNPFLWNTAERQGRAHSFDMINLTLELRDRIEALEVAENERRFREGCKAIEQATPEQIRAADVALTPNTALTQKHADLSSALASHISVGYSDAKQQPEPARTGSLLERLAIMCADFASTATAGQSAKPLARAAIREVAAWIKRRQEDDYGVVIPDVREVIDWLEREAKR